MEKISRKLLGVNNSDSVIFDVSSSVLLSLRLTLGC